MKPITWLIIGGVVLLAIIIIISISISTVGATEWALRYSTIDQNINGDKVYEGGRYMVGPFAKFISFPRTAQTVEFSTGPNAIELPLATRTNDGLALTLHFSFQYKLVRDAIPELYRELLLNYERTFRKIARELVLKTAGSFNAEDYWKKRTEIGERMRTNLEVSLKQTSAECVGFQLLEIDLPSSFENSIVQTQVEKQNVIIKEYEQQASLIRKAIDVDISENNKNISIIHAAAVANATIITQQAKSSSAARTIDVENEAYNNVTRDLNL